MLLTSYSLLLTTYYSLGERGVRPPFSHIQPFALPIHLPAGGAIADGAGEQPHDKSPVLLPCLGWYDSTHVALTSYYKQFIFSGEASR